MLLLFVKKDCPIAGVLAATTTVTITTTYLKHGGNGNERDENGNVEEEVTSTGSWSQDTATWSNAPSTPRDVKVGTFGEVMENIWHGFDVVGRGGDGDEGREGGDDIGSVYSVR
mmetsp:Transcript_898/g.1923  ORF Transcript_898/g.1923 Transcript_898/m.1923 type:complete len:114 (+) Transcript_898:511-852(+)